MPRLDVMIVEDEPVSRRALTSLVTASGLTTHAFASAEEALVEMQTRGAPRVLLVDLHLPGMSGIELLRRVEQGTAAVFPVLITAAGADALAQVRRHYPGICLRKPLDFDRLLSVLGDRFSVN